jgi:pimeloyl-ACP methyl ester carboxylesterase
MISRTTYSRISAVLALFVLCWAPPARAADIVVSLEVARTPITGPAPVIQRYILFDLTAIPATVSDPIQAKGVIVLFSGGGGRLGIGDGQLSILQTNFLVRTRHHFAAQGFHVAVPDAATDFLLRPQGLGADRTSAAHMQDVAAVITDLRSRFPGLPIWLVGTSRGTISAANAAAVLTGAAAPDGLVLTSALTQPGLGNPESLQNVPLAAIHVPALVVAHRDDTCAVTPPADAKDLIRALRNQHRRSDLRFFDGGFAPVDDPCEALTAHGFFGIEPKVVEAIGKFILRSIED